MNEVGNSIGTNVNQNMVKSFNQSQENFTENDVLSGKIQSSQNGKYTIALENNLQIRVEENSIVGEVGDIVTFEVVNSNTLKQTFSTSTTSYSLYNSEVEFKDLNSTDILSTEDNKYNVFLSENKLTDTSTLYSISRIKNNISEISNLSTEEIINELIQNGIKPEDLDTETFSQYLKDTSLDNEDNEPIDLIELKEKVYKNIKFDLNMNGVDEESAMRFEEVLLKSSLPITEKNMQMVKSTSDKLDELKNLSDTQIYSIIRDIDGKNGISIDDLYSSKHSGIYTTATSIEELNSIPNLDEQITSLLENDSIIQDEKNIQLAKNFILEGIEVSADSFNKFSKLQTLKNQDNIDIISENFKNNNIFFNGIAEIKKYKEIEVEERDIQILINRNIPVTLGNLYQNSKNDVSSSELSQNNLSESDISELAKMEKLNLAKIQLKLTTENMYAIAKNGIDIDTKPLSKVIETLEHLENESIKNTLATTNTPITEQNINTMKDVSETLKNFYPNNVYTTFKGIISDEVTFNLDGIKQNFRVKNIIEDFEVYKTQPIKSFGDNMEKMKEHFASFLEEKGFEPTETNMKALKILSLNDMDATSENIIKTKIIDEKLNYVHDNLHPLTVSKMLNNNFNPMEKTIDEVIEYIEETKEDFQQSSREKIAEHILNLDSENNLSEEERSAMVAIYRMLNAINSVEKGDSGAIGVILQNDKTLTFKNLLEASKIYNMKAKKLSLDKVVDDNSGAVKNQKVNTIQSTINTAVEKLNSEYNTILTKKVVENSNPEAIKQAIDSNTPIEDIDFTPISINDNKKDLELLQEIRDFEKTSSEIIDMMVKNEIPITLNNVSTMKNILKNNDKKPSDVISDFKQEMASKGIKFGESIFNLNDDSIISKEEALDTLAKLEEENAEAFDDILDLDNLDIIKSMILKNRDVSVGIKFLQDNNRIKNGVYSLPMELSSGKITDLNMFILNDKALDDKNLKFYLNFENNDRNQVQAFVETFNNGTSVNISTNKEYFENIEHNKADIFSILARFNINPENTTYSVQDDRNIFEPSSLIF